MAMATLPALGVTVPGTVSETNSYDAAPADVPLVLRMIFETSSLQTVLFKAGLITGSGLTVTVIVKAEPTHNAVDLGTT